MASKVLVVDDDASGLTAAVRHLISYGFEVVGVANAADALHLVDGGRHFDLVLSDQHMPEMTGLELLSALRARGNRVLFVLWSGGGSGEESEERLAARCADLGVRFLAKPVKGLAQIIKAVLANHRHS